MAVPVKTYLERYVGMPQLDDNWGDMTTMLDAVLVNGFNPRVITAITRVDQVGTASCVGHGYEIDQCVTIAGAVQPEYNGEFLVTAKGADWFSFLIVGAPASPATTATAFGAIASPLGFEIMFSDTRRRCYRSKDALSNRRILVVDDNQPAGYTTTYAKYARVIIAENMADAYTVLGSQAPYDVVNPNKSFGTSGSGTSIIAGWFKWLYATPLMGGGAMTTTPSAGSRHFTIIGDSRAFWFFIQPPSSSHNWNPIKAGYAFGEWPSFKTADPYNTVLIAHEMYFAPTTGMYVGYYNYFPTMDNTQGKTVLRDFSGTLAAASFSACGFSLIASASSGYLNGAASVIPYPNGPSGALIIYPVYQREFATQAIRGTWPGLYHTPHPYVLGDRAYVESVPGLPGRKLMCVEVSTSSNNGSGANTNPRVFVDVTGPWR